ncbi:MAG: RIP metalloprotease RseP [Acidobacteria bacterium]|nr:RIP metalloprotease RseP [Acidobacteriota bacterium]
MLLTLLLFLVVLGPMIFIHEFGHFAVAKLLKIKVEVFSLGFGPRLLGFNYGDTDYRVSAIPLGGYVKMKGETLDEDIEGTGDEFLSRPRWHRFLVLIAGPVMNILSAIAIPAAMAMFMFQSPAYLTQPAVVGSVALGSAAEKAGIQPGDRILQIDGKTNPTWGQVSDSTILRPDQPLSVTVQRNTQQLQLTLTPSRIQFGQEKLGDSGLLQNDLTPMPIQVKAVNPGTPAEAGGLKPGDKIVKFNGQPVVHFHWFKSSVRNFEGKPIELEVDRNGQMVPLHITPRQEPRGDVMVGFAPEPSSVPLTPMITQNKSFPAAFRYAVDENIRVLVLTGDALGQIFTGHRAVKETLAGPLGIAKMSSDTYQSLGVEGLLRLMALLSLNLGVFNLLPIPVLDGGHIFIIFLETLFGWVGLQITNGFKEKMMQTGAVLLFLLMGYVIYIDVARLFTERSATKATTKPAAVDTSPPPATPTPTPAPGK